MKPLTRRGIDLTATDLRGGEGGGGGGGGRKFWKGKSLKQIEGERREDGVSESLQGTACFSSLKGEWYAAWH